MLIFLYRLRKGKAAKVDASVALMVRSRESLRSPRDGLEVCESAHGEGGVREDTIFLVPDQQSAIGLYVWLRSLNYQTIRSFEIELLKFFAHWILN